MSATAIEDLDIDWAGSTTIVHASTATDTGGTDVQCPCGWRALIGEAPGPNAHMPRTMRAAYDHSRTHEGQVYVIVRNTDGEIVREWWA